MAAGGIDVEFEGDFFFLQGAGVGEGVFDADGIVGGHGDESFWRVFRDRKFRGELGRVFFGDEVAGVNEDGEVRFEGEGVGRVDFFVGAFLRAGAEDGGEMSARGKAEDADAFWIDVPFGRVLTDEAHGALSVFEGRGVFFAAGAARDAIFQEDSGEAHFVKALADFGAFEVERENMVGAAGADEDRAAVGIVFRSRINGDGGIGDVAEADEAAVGDFVVGIFSGVFFGLEFWFVTGRAVRPEREGFLGGGCVGGDESRDASKEDAKDAMVHGGVF